MTAANAVMDLDVVYSTMVLHLSCHKVMFACNCLMTLNTTEQ